MGRRDRPKKLSDEEAEAKLNTLLIDTGERDKLRAKLHDTLERDGWREDVKALVKDILRDKPNISMEELVQEVAPKATDMVRDKTRKNMAEDVRVVLEKAANE